MRDEAGFAAFVAARGPALLRLAWLYTADRAGAEDLLQEALVRVVPRWDGIAESARESYVRTVMRSAWVDSWRRRRGLRLLAFGLTPGGGGTADAEPDAWGTGPGDAAGAAGHEQALDRITLAEALGRLTPRQRAVLVLRFYEDLTETQTAQALGCTVSTVKSQTRHALTRLRTLAPELAETFGRAAGRAGRSPGDSPPYGDSPPHGTSVPTDPEQAPTAGDQLSDGPARATAVLEKGAGR